MGSFVTELADAIALIGDSEDERRAEIARKCIAVRRSASRAIADEHEWSVLVGPDTKPEDVPSMDVVPYRKTRSAIIHHARCKTLARLAGDLRAVMIEAMGTLRIDETTADTGLDEDERRMIADIVGKADPV